VRTLLDSLASYFVGERATIVTVAVEYERPGELRRTTKLTHDFDLYRELAYRI
jgi:hypothetical protein